MKKFIICAGCGATDESDATGRCTHCFSNHVHEFSTGAAFPTLAEVEVEIAQLESLIASDPMGVPLTLAKRLADLRKVRHVYMVEIWA